MTRPRPVSPLWDAPKTSRAPVSTWPPTTPGSSQAPHSPATAATRPAPPELPTQPSAGGGPTPAGAGTYLAPAPPPGHGHHSYYFELYALDADLALPAGLDRAELLARIDDHNIEQARIVGTYSG